MMKCIRDFVSGWSGRKISDLTCLKSYGELQRGNLGFKKKLGYELKKIF
jgi:hypothetical protein